MIQVCETTKKILNDHSPQNNQVLRKIIVYRRFRGPRIFAIDRLRVDGIKYKDHADFLKNPSN